MSRRFVQESDREDIAAFITEHWRSPAVVSLGKLFHPHEHEGIIERRDNRIVGLLTFCCDDGKMHFLTHNSTLSGERIGSVMTLMAIDLARERGLDGIWLSTSNDNLRAVGFYQKLGFRITEVRPGAMTEARKLKPEIPELGQDGIPVLDELVLRLRVKPYIDR